MINTENFIKRAILVHGNKYDYSKVEYKGMLCKVCIVCPEHGEFWQRPSNHLQGKGCPICANKSTIKNNFSQQAEVIHGNKYDYSKVEYINGITKVCIICPEHGEFWQNPHSHLYGHGCPKCHNKVISDKKIITFKYSIEKFVEKSKKKHNDRYDYSKVEYINGITKVCIICPEHGEFWQKPSEHLRGCGCPKCANNGVLLTTSVFVKRARKVHGDKYDYSKVEYVNGVTKVHIICPEHGEFWQKPNSHLQGNGCPKCSESSMERDLSIFFDENNIVYERQKKFSWLIHKRHMSLDFYLPDYNVAIECQGEQHFKPVRYFGGIDKYNDLINRDKLKYELCLLHNINILYVTNYIDIKNEFYKNKIYLIENFKKEKLWEKLY